MKRINFIRDRAFSSFAAGELLTPESPFPEKQANEPLLASTRKRTVLRKKIKTI